MLITCGAAWRWGARPERLGAVLLAVTWVVVLIGQLAMGGRRMEPIIIGDCIYGSGLLVISGVYWRVWSWLSIALEAVAFFIHALMYQGIVNESYAYAYAMNVISILELLLLLGAALLNLRARGLVRPH
ncbi:MAG: hypothetical protein WA840_19680 [Caulobacteraceae bacterium]